MGGGGVQLLLLQIDLTSVTLMAFVFSARPPEKSGAAVPV